MDWKFLFTSMDGRIGRMQFWIGVIILIVASIILSMVVGSILGVSMLSSMMAMQDGMPNAAEMMALNSKAGWLGLVMFAITAYPALCISLKRRHDRGSAGRLVWASFGLSLLTIVLQITGLGYQTMDMGGMPVVTPNILTSLVSIASLIIGIYLLVVMGFLKGDSGDNAYGPDPLA